MPLSPSPLMPGTSSFPDPGRRPPNGRALRLGALLTLPLLLIALLAGPFGLPALWRVVGGFNAQINGGLPGAGGAQFQGFVYTWSAQMKGGGYTQPASLQNMQTQANWFHMNAVIIPVVADMPNRDQSCLTWVAAQKINCSGTSFTNKDTLPESDYEQAIKDARTAKLIPILELQVVQYGPTADHSSDLVGRVWANARSSVNVAGTAVGSSEKGWFDNYAAFASEYARLSAKYNLPYYIIGDDLSDVTTDGPNTTAKTDPNGIDHGVPGESFPTCPARRDCEWRHVVHAIQSQTYATFGNHKPAPLGGGNYSGKLIYAASWRGATEGATAPEFENITWWDALSSSSGYIGVDAYFPLTQNESDVSAELLQNSWNGQPPCVSKDLTVCPGDIVARLASVSGQYNLPVVFTEAGYGSVPGANSGPPFPPGGNLNTPDNPEQLYDMQALLDTFSGQTWWAGVFWNGDEPISPRSGQQNWATSSNWAGDTLASSKDAGKWLATYYKSNPIKCSC
jgi:hypothetical protein